MPKNILIVYLKTNLDIFLRNENTVVYMEIMNQPLVSVITPAYNAEKYIGDAIDSILAQNFKKFEFIIIDDCSTDKTWDIICQYATKDHRIVAIKNEKNLGIAGNRNKGVSLAKGEYIMWQDADDISVPERIERQYQFLETHSKVGIVGGFLHFFNEEKENCFRKYDAEDLSLRKKIFRYSPIAQPAAMIRKKCLEEVGGYNLAYPPAEDLDMSFRIGEKYQFANLQEVMIYYREHPNSATFTRLKKIEFSTLEIRRKYNEKGTYKMTIFDKIYNFLHYISVFFIPPKMKIWLFRLGRDSKL